ncbi:MAG: heavy metal-binding domain-containing protein [Paraclostridium sp.]
MLIVTTESIPGKKITQVKGLVKGSTIRAKHIGKDIGAGLKQLVGGELTGYDEMMTEARKIAIGRMVEDANSKGANAIVGFRLTSAAVMQGAAEMLAYGTAVVVEDNE